MDARPWPGGLADANNVVETMVRNQFGSLTVDGELFSTLIAEVYAVADQLDGLEP